MFLSFVSWWRYWPCSLQSQPYLSQCLLLFLSLLIQAFHDIFHTPVIFTFTFNVFTFTVILCLKNLWFQCVHATFSSAYLELTTQDSLWTLLFQYLVFWQHLDPSFPILFLQSKWNLEQIAGKISSHHSYILKGVCVFPWLYSIVFSFFLHFLRKELLCGHTISSYFDWQE